MTEKVGLPMGIEDFERIRKDDFYYVDKTGLIKELLLNQAYVNLFTRPRRFGKTLNMSMLKSFLKLETIALFLMALKLQMKVNYAIDLWENFQLLALA